MSIENDLLQFISVEVVQEPVELEEPLISSGKVDSLGLIRILGYIDENYRAGLLSSASPEDFDSVKSLAAAIRRSGGDGAL